MTSRTAEPEHGADAHGGAATIHCKRTSAHGGGTGNVQSAVGVDGDPALAGWAENRSACHLEYASAACGIADDSTATGEIERASRQQIRAGENRPTIADLQPQRPYIDGAAGLVHEAIADVGGRIVFVPEAHPTGVQDTASRHVVNALAMGEGGVSFTPVTNRGKSDDVNRAAGVIDGADAVGAAVTEIERIAAIQDVQHAAGHVHGSGPAGTDHQATFDGSFAAAHVEGTA